MLHESLSREYFSSFHHITNCCVLGCATTNGKIHHGDAVSSVPGDLAALCGFDRAKEHYGHVKLSF